ncbi:MAG: biotin/lipoyl-binding carrier protein [Deltaproteobacteria bacterium]|nr:biotin/lipoyl-binding carrier protein [Deltaproteobacteria bacterium]MCB9478327.1 biotin/lipoyl-binding carrier protein [Deltaproteobacteria bacterium]MCB9489311.1 biotin/lipoyl-binding carrier protein [Deltaproteobacteria bacterium]
MAEQEAKSEVTGNVWKIVMNVGDEVEEGDEILILESMKMEIPVEAPCDGTITKILVKEGDQVEADQVMALVEES